MTQRASVLDFLPEMYRAILPADFERPLEEERKATCETCVMCTAGGEKDVPPGFFSPSTKCCTYHPVLPNFAVGGLVLDESDEGRVGRLRILEKIRRRIGVTPLGIGPSRKDGLLYRNGTRGFGLAASLVCPYLDQERGRCSVWKFREGVCTTWFCKHNAGQDGRSFWQQLGVYLIGTELILSAHALRELGWDVDRILVDRPPDGDLDARALDDAPPSDADYAALWGDWVGREVEHYLRTYEIVRSVDRNRFAALGGIRHTLALDRLNKRYEQMRTPSMPDTLMKNPGMRTGRTLDGGYVLVSYAGFDPTRLRKPVYELLDAFDGQRLTSDVRTRVLGEHGYWLSDGLIRRLFQHRVLVEAAHFAG